MSQPIDLDYVDVDRLTLIMSLPCTRTFLNDLFLYVEDSIEHDLHLAQHYIDKYDDCYKADVTELKKEVEIVHNNLKTLKKLIFKE